MTSFVVLIVTAVAMKLTKTSIEFFNLGESFVFIEIIDPET